MSKKSVQDKALMSMDGHIDVLRAMLMRILGVTAVFATVIFCLKDKVFELLLAPHSSHFITFRLLEKGASAVGLPFHFQDYDIRLISTELSSQFVIHLSTSVYLGL